MTSVSLAQILPYIEIKYKRGYMAMSKYTTIRGMSDVMPPESRLWDHIESVSRDVFTSFGCREIRTPVVEMTGLFTRSIGESTSIVEKEMYTFLDRDGESLSLRPEGTASVVRAYIESGGSEEKIAKYFYMGPMFRHERPQKGRKRQFHQIGVEFIGSASPATDAEVIATFAHIMKRLGIGEYSLELNSIGCPKCRPAYHEKFLRFLKERVPHLCADCIRRIEKNPLRAFDCKVDACRRAMEGAPEIGTHLCGECGEHFAGVQQYLRLLGIPYEINHRIVRGLDYYSRTAFEFKSDKLGAQDAICAGGRYDGLVESMGGPDVPGVGFSIGVERVVLLIEAMKKVPKFEHELVFFALLGAGSANKALPLINMLRMDGINCEWDPEGRSLKAQMRRAGRLEAHTVVIIGEEELKKGIAVVRNMHTKEQEDVRIDDLPRHFVHVEM